MSYKGKAKVCLEGQDEHGSTFEIVCLDGIPPATLTATYNRDSEVEIFLLKMAKLDVVELEHNLWK